MSKYPLEWGWHHQPEVEENSTAPASPRETLLGGKPRENDVHDAASGDRKCQGYCADGGDWGTTGAYEIRRRIYCKKCAVKKLGIEDEPGDEQNRTLKWYELQSR
jgi:hypothetical protein